jgi:hypothetical protein
VKNTNRRNFETVASENNKQQAVTASTFRPFRRRTFTPSTTVAAPTTVRAEGSANRFRNYRRNATDAGARTSSSTTSRRPFTPRTTAESVTSSTTTESLTQTTKSSPTKKTPLTRGNFRPKEKTSAGGVTGGAAKDDEDNYPEHFKQLLKTKEVNTQQNDKSVLKKPVKHFKPTERTASTRPVYPTRQNRFTPKITTTSTTEASSPKQLATVTPKRPLRSRPRPTEKTRVSVGSTLQEPPTAKTTPTYVTSRAPVKQALDEINTPTDEFKQIDPPIREYFPRTSAVSCCRLRFALINRTNRSYLDWLLVGLEVFFAIPQL